MRNLFALFFLSTLYSCASVSVPERDLMLQGRAKSIALTKKTITDHESELKNPETLDWYILFYTDDGKTKTKITSDLIKVADDIYCEVAKEHKQLMFEQHPGMMMKWAQCKYLLEYFELRTYCDPENNIMLQNRIKDEQDFKIALKCEDKKQ